MMKTRATRSLILSVLCVVQAVADTPEKLADPEALRQSIRRLAEQDCWTDFATRTVGKGTDN